MKSLIVGLGIGELYKSILSTMGSVTTVDADPKKQADYTSINNVTGQYDLAYIGTPNHTHEALARTAARFSKIVLIEKPGVISSHSWKQMTEDFPHTRFIMVKNNQYRNEIDLFRELQVQAKSVTLCWSRKNCIPHPGSWFTNKEKAFGGVSRDLMPHMLSYYTALTDFNQGKTITATAVQNHRLADITHTDYGVINRAGVYDVDDRCEITIHNGILWKFVTDWKNDHSDNSSITFELDEVSVSLELGWCPDAVYENMIKAIISNVDNDEFWKKQFNEDMWIHQQVDSL